jgi:enamine deaminase RidA (YjgF/YER057c/UK114 family)
MRSSQEPAGAPCIDAQEPRDVDAFRRRIGDLRRVNAGGTLGERELLRRLRLQRGQNGVALGRIGQHRCDLAPGGADRISFGRRNRRDLRIRQDIAETLARPGDNCLDTARGEPGEQSTALLQLGLQRKRPANAEGRRRRPPQSDRIAALKTDGLSVRAIAQALDRSPATISRELRRNALASGATATPPAGEPECRPVSYIDPPGTAPAQGLYSHIGKPSRGGLIFIAAQLSVDLAGNIVGKNDFTAQFDQVFTNLGAVLTGRRRLNQTTSPQRSGGIDRDAARG